jgi:phage repressor protein C with HTH and peptisase S24 domain
MSRQNIITGHTFVEEPVGSIGDRIRELRGEMQQSELADKMGVHKNTMANYERGDRFPDVNILLKILEVFPDTNPAWLLTGEGSKNRSEPVQGGFVMFPRYEIEVGAGPGRNVQSEQVVDFVSFKEEWVQNFLRVPRKDLALLSVKGDSMNPTLNDGDMILVDLRSERIEDSAIYVLEFDDALLVKRIQRKLDGSVVIKSDNQLYDAEILQKDRAEALKIIGRVVWSGRRM